MWVSLSAVSMFGWLRPCADHSQNLSVIGDKVDIKSPLTYLSGVSGYELRLSAHRGSQLSPWFLEVTAALASPALDLVSSSPLLS